MSIIAILNFIKGIKLKYILIGLGIALLLTLAYYVDKSNRLSKEVNRQVTNMEQVTNEHVKQLTLKQTEYKALEGEFKEKIDSVIRFYKIKLKNVKEVTVVKTVYRDTGKVKIVYRDKVVQLPDNSYSIPIDVEDVCWGFKGNILSKDRNSELTITERSSSNSIQIIVTEKRRWLFWKKQGFKAVGDCGDISVTNVKFIK